jgi:hypothetical protein
VRTNKQHKHPLQLPMETLVRHPAAEEAHSHQEVVGAVHQEAVGEAQKPVGAGRTPHTQHTAFAPDAIPFVVVGRQLAFLRVRSGRLRGGLRLGLLRGLLGLRLGRWRDLSG